jgi:hypothetical protein
MTFGKRAVYNAAVGWRFALIVAVLAGGCAGWRVPSGEKNGPLMVDVKAGPAIGLHDTGGVGRPALSCSRTALF